jgi:ketosteroid isomerase-like protein
MQFHKGKLQMKYKTLITACAILGSVNLLYAVTPPAPTSDEKDREQLRAMKAVYEKAVNENNLELLKPMIRDDFSFVTFTDSEFDRRRDDFSKFKSDWNETRNKLLKGGSYTVELLPERSLILNDLVAIARGDSKNLIKRGDGKEFSFSAKWTAICVKEGGEWKVLRAHNSLNPFENPLIKDAVQSMLAKTSAISGLIGLVVGVVITWILMKKKPNPGT